MARLVTTTPSTTPPSGAAGGDLTGTFPNPTIGTGKATAVKLGSGVVAANALATADGAGAVTYIVQSVRTAAGVPSGAPVAGELPIAYDSTAVTGGTYYWTGAAWVKIATIL